MTTILRARFLPGRPTVAFTLIEVMVVMAVIAIVVAIATPTWLRQRELSRGRACQETLSKIDGAKEQYALEFKANNGATVTMDDIVVPPGSTAGQGYLRGTPLCPSSGTYELNVVGAIPECTIGDTIAPWEPHIMQGN